MKPLIGHITLCIALLSVACTKNPIEEQREHTLVVDALIRSGEGVDHFEVRTLSPDGHLHPKPVSDLEITVFINGEAQELIEHTDTPGKYFDPQRSAVSPSDDLSMQFLWKGNMVSASTTAAPLLEGLEMNKAILSVDDPDDVIFLEWEDVNEGSFNEFLYIIETEPIGHTEDLTPLIHQNNGASLRNSKLTYVAETGLSLEDFDFVGPHVLRIYAVGRQYEHFFRPQTDYTVNGPDNIDGGVGQFLGAGVIEATIEVR